MPDDGFAVSADGMEAPYTASWQLWPSSSERALPLSRSIDQALTDHYLFYPEVDWAKFGYRPPDSGSQLGAWRDREGSVFAFLIESPPRTQKGSDGSMVLIVTGRKSAVELVGKRVVALKANLSKSERRELQLLEVGHRIELEKKSPAIARLVAMIGLLTVLINAFSLYLRKLPPPNIPITWIQDVYLYALVVVHFASLMLLLIVTLFGISYAIRYGLLILRRF